jgi:hypothetical protein
LSYKGDVTEVLMACKERMEIFTNTYEDATVKRSSEVLGETCEMAKTKEHQSQGWVEGCMADHKCSHIFCLTSKCASTDSSISTNILQMLVNIPNKVLPLPL